MHTSTLVCIHDADRTEFERRAFQSRNLLLFENYFFESIFIRNWTTYPMYPLARRFTTNTKNKTSIQLEKSPLPSLTAHTKIKVQLIHGHTVYLRSKSQTVGLSLRKQDVFIMRKKLPLRSLWFSRSLSLHKMSTKTTKSILTPRTNYFKYRQMPRLILADESGNLVQKDGNFSAVVTTFTVRSDGDQDAYDVYFQNILHYMLLFWTVFKCLSCDILWKWE